MLWCSHLAVMGVTGQIDNSKVTFSLAIDIVFIVILDTHVATDSPGGNLFPASDNIVAVDCRSSGWGEGREAGESVCVVSERV